MTQRQAISQPGLKMIRLDIMFWEVRDMRALLYLAGLLALAATPAIAQTAPRSPAEPAVPPPASSYMGNGPDRSNSRFYLEDTRRQCFNGRFIVGSNRQGDRTVYVQTKRGGVYQLELARACHALDITLRLTVKADSDDVVCEGQRATIMLNTPNGPKRCAVTDVRRLSAKEMALLATAAQR